MIVSLYFYHGNNFLISRFDYQQLSTNVNENHNNTNIFRYKLLYIASFLNVNLFYSN